MAHARVYMMELKQALFKELAGASIDRKKIQDLKGKLKEKKDLQSELMIDNMLVYAEILTPERRKKIRIKKIGIFWVPKMNSMDRTGLRPQRHRRIIIIIVVESGD